MKNLKLGCDPELFLIDVTGQLKSAIGLIGGSKEVPQQLPDLGDGFAVQEDNVAMEFNIPAASDAHEFIMSLDKALSYLGDAVGNRYGLKLATISAASFPESELQTPAALVFGCDPDYNAWTGNRNPKPKAEDKNLRSCGGHIHVGYDKEQARPDAVIRYMDLFLGVPSILMDSGDLRKELYGKAGAYREKSYGVEYRTLSNFWIFQKQLVQWAWDNTERAVDAAVARLALSGDDEARIVQCINSNDKGMARELVDQFQLAVV